jgi:hypothetical protein
MRERQPDRKATTWRRDNARPRAIESPIGDDLPASLVECPGDVVRIPFDELEVGPSWLIWFSAALFPMVRCAQCDMEPLCKFFLRKLQSSADYLHLRRARHLLEICCR